MKAYDVNLLMPSLVKICSALLLMIHTDGWIWKTSSLFGHFMCLVQKMSFSCKYPLSLEKRDVHFATSCMDTMINL
jgi:hypothetical protein